MKRLLFLFLFSLSINFFYLLSANNDTLWVNTLGTYGDDDVKVTDCSNNGDIFYAGNYSGLMDGSYPQNNHDIYLRRVNSDGSTAWTLTVNSPEFAIPTALTYDENRQSIHLIVFYLGIGSYDDSRSVIHSFDHNGNVLGSSIFEKCLLTDIQIKDTQYVDPNYIICGAYGSDANINSYYNSYYDSSPIEINLPRNINVTNMNLGNGSPAGPGGPGGQEGQEDRRI